MPIKPSAAKITDFETSFDAAPVTTAEGEVIWADVRIDYILAGLTPSVTIRNPVPWREGDTPEARKSMALRCARELIDHACIAAGIPSPPIPTRTFVIPSQMPCPPSKGSRKSSVLRSLQHSRRKCGRPSKTAAHN